jgi:hypothetical protein
MKAERYINPMRVAHAMQVDQQRHFSRFSETTMVFGAAIVVVGIQLHMRRVSASKLLRPPPRAFRLLTPGNVS